MKSEYGISWNCKYKKKNAPSKPYLSNLGSTFAFTTLLLTYHGNPDVGVLVMEWSGYLLTLFGTLIYRNIWILARKNHSVGRFWEIPASTYINISGNSI